MCCAYVFSKDLFLRQEVGLLPFSRSLVFERSVYRQSNLFCFLCTPLYTSLHTSTPLYASLHLATPLYTSLRIFAPFYTFLHLYASLHLSRYLYLSQHLSTPPRFRRARGTAQTNLEHAAKLMSDGQLTATSIEDAGE